VSAETTRFLDLLEQRISLLGLLTEALNAARADVVQFDINGLEGRIRDQERLCIEIHSIDSRINVVQRQCATQLCAHAGGDANGVATPDADSVRLRETMDRLNKVQMNVKQLNEQHRALLRRSRRTVSALLNSLQSFATTYSNPSATHVLAGERF
jgi:FlgN protein